MYADLPAARSHAAPAEKQDVNLFYLDGDFSGVVEYFKDKEYTLLPLDDKLLFIECLARSSLRMEARERLAPLLESSPDDPDVLAAAGFINFSLGSIEKAVEYTDLALKKDPVSQKAILAKITQLLFFRNFKKAENHFSKLLLTSDAVWKESELVFQIGLDVYKGLREPDKLSLWYENRGQQKKKTEKALANSLNSTAKIIKNAKKNRFFQAELTSNAAIYPFSEEADLFRINTIPLVTKKSTFQVLLDTGNAAGWIVHGVELNEILKPKKGGPITARVGAERGSLSGYNQYNKLFDLGEFKVKDLIGVYVPKPRPDYPDANLNPAFIDGYVTTLDFFQNRFILQTTTEFERQIRTIPEVNICILPWYGDKYVFIPVTVNQNAGLAMIETGAEDIAVKLDFAHKNRMALIPQSKYQGEGDKVDYFKTEVTLTIGKFQINNKAAEVWEFKNFHNPLKCFSPDLIIGPKAFKGKYSISFNPISSQVYIIRADFKTHQAE